MTTVKEEALRRIGTELQGEHTNFEKIYFDWLSTQEDEELFESIIKESKTLSGANSYVWSEASKIQEQRMTGVEGDIVFNWLVEYFKKPEAEIVKSKVVKELKTMPKAQACINQVKKAVTPKPKEPKGKMMEGEQLNLLDFL